MARKMVLLSSLLLHFQVYGPAFDEYYSIHLTNEDILFINYKKINNKLIVINVHVNYVGGGVLSRRI